MKKSAVYFREIPLYPTQFYVDVWVCEDRDLLAKHFKRRYDMSQDYFDDKISPNQVCDIEIGGKAKLCGHTRILMNVIKFDLPVIVYELNHVVYHLAALCGLKTNEETQEWVSYLLEYLFERCKNKDGFKKCC